MIGFEKNKPDKSRIKILEKDSIQKKSGVKKY